MYTLYTLPNCSKCATVKDLLQREHVDYTEVNLGTPKGMAEFKKLYPNIRDRLKRTDDGGVVLPVLLRRKESDIVAISQTAEETEKLLKVS